MKVNKVKVNVNVAATKIEGKIEKVEKCGDEGEFGSNQEIGREREENQAI